MAVPAPDVILGNSGGWALCLDIDGTLLDMAPEPDAVVVPPRVVQILAGLANTFDGAVGLSTGRPVADADRLFAPLQLPTCGVHGTEARLVPEGEIMRIVPPIPAALAGAVEEIARMVPGVLVEVKGAGVAVHYRNALDARPLLERELARLLARHSDFAVRPGRKVFEILPHRHSKGTALVWLMGMSPFQGRRPIMIGDDAGDQPALTIAREHGGLGLKVAGEHFSRTEADFRSISHVRAWLAALAGVAADGADSEFLTVARNGEPVRR